MTEKGSPHRRWLGLAQAQPDFFQLLGVERNENRPEVFRTAAEARLGLLKAFGEAEGREQRKALAEEVKLAFATLANPAKREEYLQSLKPLPPPVSPAPPPLVIPVAVPIAQPMSSSPSPVISGLPLAQPAPQSQDPLAAVAALESKQRRRKAGKSRTWTLTGLGLVLFLGGPLLIIGIIWFNSQDRLKSADRVAAVQPAATKQPAPNKPAATGAFTGLTPQPLPDSETGDPGTVDVADEASETTDNAGAATIEEEGGMSGPPDGPPMEQPVEFASASVRELNRVIWNDLRYRDAATARQRLQLAKGVLTSAPEAQQVKALEEVVEQLDKYWKQLIQSAAKLRTGEVQWGTETAGFVESTDQYVLVKVKGIGLKVSWEYLPPDIATQLVEQAPLADIPAWRLAKATALMLDIQTAREQEPLIRQWLAESADDGYETANLEWVLDQRVARSPAGRKSPPPSGEALEQAKRTLRELLPEKNIAANNIAGRQTAIEQLLAEAARQADPAVKYVALERAREHAVRKVDIPLCRELLESLATAFDFSVESRMLESVSDMAAYVQNANQAEKVCEAILVSSGVSLTELVKGSVEPKTLRVAEELARKQGLKQMLDRIHYLTGRD